MNKYLSQLFLKLEEHIQHKNYVLKIINHKKFKKLFVKEEQLTLFNSFSPRQPKEVDDLEPHFVFDENKIDEYVCNLMICKWLWDHKDTRYKDFTFILRPNKIQIDLREISFDDLMRFMSPQTNRTKALEAKSTAY